MRIEIPKIWKKVELKDYAPEFGEAQIPVWVNPSRSMLEKLYENGQQFKPETTEENVDLLAKIWDMAAEDVKELMDSSAESDPLFFTWLIIRTFKLIEEHRNLLKKNWMREFLKQPDEEKQASN
jgi:hypothetical protein